MTKVTECNDARSLADQLQELEREVARLNDVLADTAADAHHDAEDLRAKVVKLTEERDGYRSVSIKPPFWSTIDTGHANPYTCRILIRIDAMLYRLRGRRIAWIGGKLCERMPAGHGVELRGHFPLGWFKWAADVQLKHRWTRWVLSL